MKARLAQLQAEPHPNREAAAQAWKEVLKAYSTWTRLEQSALDRQAEIEELELKMRDRRRTLQKTATRQMIHKIRSKLDPKFLRLEESEGGEAS